MDAVSGGRNVFTMAGPDGEEVVNRGLYLEVIPNRKLVFTGAFVDAWLPSEKAFMVGVITVEPHENGTLYTAQALHWSEADRESHEEMGFHLGWGIATDQLTALAATL